MKRLINSKNSLFLFSVILSLSRADSPYWHDRYHGWLAMSAYGNYATLCPQTFTTASLQKNFPNSTEPPFTIITEWGPTSLGMTGYNVVVPEMNKTVMVFSGVFGWQSFNATPVPMPLVDCPDCTVHADAWNTFLEAKALTNNWADVQTVEAYNGHIWSVTGHGFGGMVAQIAAVQLGYQGLAHAVHSFGAARVFNKASADLYNKLFEGESGSRTVANEDSEVAWIPESQSYTMVEQGFHVWGTNSTYGQNYISCGFNNLDPDCLGGDNEADHYFYYTEIGHCGENYALDQYNPALESQDLASELSAYSATNTVPLPASFTLSTSTTTTTTTTATTTKTATTATSGRTTTLVSGSATATGSQGSTSGGIKLVSSGVISIVGALLVGVAGALAL